MMEEKTYPAFLLLMATRYFLFAGITFSVFYVLFKRRFLKLKIQKLFPKKKDYYREIGYSFSTMVIFSFYAALIFKSPFSQFTRIYKDVNEHSLGYLFLSVVLAIIIHDAYFYWTHRLMHHPKLFRFFHLVHHKSTNPSPWAAYSFHPSEAIVEGGVILVVTTLIPIHPIAIALFMLFMISFNVYGHLGYEIFPRSILKTKLGIWLNTSTNHNMHHHYFKGNYGLYFRFWDEMMGTTHPDYLETIKELKEL